VRYLKDVHGIDLEEKTLANRNAGGRGPKPEYFGTVPFYRTEVLDDWAETAFTAESPVAETRRKAAALAATRSIPIQRKTRSRANS
jgi:hypothetical protein